MTNRARGRAEELCERQVAGAPKEPMVSVDVKQHESRRKNGGVCVYVEGGVRRGGNIICMVTWRWRGRWR